MATADHRRGAVRGAAFRWTHAAALVLVAVLAVLVHHETVGAMAHVPAAAASRTGRPTGPHHSAVSPVSPGTRAHAAVSGATAPIASDAGGACSGTAVQHCSAAGVDTVKLAPPHRPFTGWAAGLPPGAAADRDVPGTTDRAPPDLSVLSRLLI